MARRGQSLMYTLFVCSSTDGDDGPATHVRRQWQHYATVVSRQLVAVGDSRSLRYCLYAAHLQVGLQVASASHHKPLP